MWTVAGPTSSPGPVHNGEVRLDGSWDVTISAPAGPAGSGGTHWFVDAECYETSPDAQTVGDVTQTYAARPLRVTSGAGADDTRTATTEPVRPGAATTTTAAPPATTTTTAAATVAAAVATTTTTAAAATSTTAAPAGGSSVAAAPADAEGIQGEIDAKRGDRETYDIVTPDDPDAVLLASPAASQRPDAPNGALPGWAFLCAAMLAVGAVIAWGAARGAGSAATRGE